MNRKYALITGGACRLGREIALDLAKHGYDIVLLYYKSNAQQTVDDVRKCGVNCEAFSFNLFDYEKISLLIENFNKQGVLEGTGLLVNNASVFLRCPPENTTARFLNKTFRVNFFAPYQLSCSFARYALPGSSIVNIADSKAAKNGTAYSAYILSKKSLIDMTLQFAAAFAPEIRVNAICPGTLLPSIGESYEKFEMRRKKAPMKKSGSTEEVCSMIRFLHENREVTGQILYADGGMHVFTGEL